MAICIIFLDFTKHLIKHTIHNLMTIEPLKIILGISHYSLVISKVKYEKCEMYSYLNFYLYFLKYKLFP